MANPWDSDPVVASSPLEAALQAEGTTGAKADLARSLYQQESSSGANTATSNANAVGGMQVQPATFDGVADKGWSINDPVQNARAGIRYASQMYDKANGDPAIAAAGYYGGPGGLAKAQQGIAVSDPRNPNAPNTLQYGAQVAARMSQQPQSSQPWDNDPVVSGETDNSAESDDNRPSYHIYINGTNADTKPLQTPYYDETNNPNYVPDPNAVRIETSGTSADITPVQAQPDPSTQPQTNSQQQGAIQNPVPTSFVDDIGRQLGLTARAAGHGIGDAVGLVANPLNHLVNSALGTNLGDVDTLIRNGVDSVTPTPQNRTEQVVGDIAGAMANPVNLIGGPVMAGSTGVLSAMGRGALAGGISGGLQPVHTEDGLGTFAGHVGAGALGGAAGGLIGASAGAVADKLLNGANSIATAIKSAMPSNQAASQISADDILQNVAQQQSINLDAIPKSILNGVRGQVADALSGNQTVNTAALLRRAEGDAILGPQNSLTLGQATRDPMQFAKEKNFRGIQGAGEPLTERYANQNNALIGALNQRGAANAPGEFNVGQSAINSIQAGDNAASSRISGLYNQARDLNGGDIPLDHVGFIADASNGLDANLKTAFLPDKYKGIMNDIATGKTPLTVGVAEQLKTMLGASGRATQDGNEKAAISIVRDALEGAQPIGNAVTPSASNVIALRGNPASQSTQANVGPEAISAFNQARAAARDRFGEIDANPALKAVVRGDAVPDNFFKRYVLNGNVGDVNSLLHIVPDQGAALRAQVVDHLKQKALNGASDEIGTFSQSGYNKALNSLGDAKLNAIFEPDQVAQLKQIGRVAANLQAQPAGAAVNNSNTAAAMMNLLDKVSGKMGFIPFVTTGKNSVKQFFDERYVKNALAATINPQANPWVSGSLNPLLPLAAPLGGAVAGQSRH